MICKSPPRRCRMSNTGDFMSAKSLFAVALAFAALGFSAQQLAAQEARPLTAMPYSPSLDLTNMDKSVDPCVDFYKYACGGWMANNPIPADQASWSVYAKLATENQQFLWGILEEDAKPSAARTPVQQKVGDYFESCMNTAAIDAAGVSPIAAVLGRVEMLSDRNRLRGYFPILHYMNPSGIFFRSSTGQDSVDSSKIIVEVEAGGLGLPDRDYYTKDDAKSVKIREQYKAY